MLLSLNLVVDSAIARFVSTTFAILRQYFNQSPPYLYRFSLSSSLLMLHKDQDRAVRIVTNSGQAASVVDLMNVQWEKRYL